MYEAAAKAACIYSRYHVHSSSSRCYDTIFIRIQQHRHAHRTEYQTTPTSESQNLTMRTNQRPRGRSYQDICALYYNTPNAATTGQSARRYLPQVRLDSHTTLSSVCYTTTLRQVFSNSSNEIISQARYTFPLYDGVVVGAYTITYGKTKLQGVV
jgi:hypothetical protein